MIKAVSGDLTVKASGIDDRHYEVILNLVGVTSQPASFDPVLVNGKVELILKAAGRPYASGYRYGNNGR